MPFSNLPRLEAIATPYLSIRFGITNLYFSGTPNAYTQITVPQSPGASKTLIVATHVGTGSFWTAAHRVDAGLIQINAQYIANLTGAFGFSWIAIDLP